MSGNPLKRLEAKPQVVQDVLACYLVAHLETGPARPFDELVKLVLDRWDGLSAELGPGEEERAARTILSTVQAGRWGRMGSPAVTS
jgi:hypothetical protein